LTAKRVLQLQDGVSQTRGRGRLVPP